MVTMSYHSNGRKSNEQNRICAALAAKTEFMKKDAEKYIEAPYPKHNVVWSKGKEKISSETGV